MELWLSDHVLLCVGSISLGCQCEVLLETDVGHIKNKIFVLLPIENLIGASTLLKIFKVFFNFYLIV